MNNRMSEPDRDRMAGRDSIIAMRAGTRPGVLGSTTMPCYLCGEQCIVSPSSREFLKQTHDRPLELICMVCYGEIDKTERDTVGLVPGAKEEAIKYFASRGTN